MSWATQAVGHSIDGSKSVINPPAAPIRRTTLKRYPLATKLKAVELFTDGMSPNTIASKLSLNLKSERLCLGPTIPRTRKVGLHEHN
ncbi:hypothetical protein [Corynebacterium diphtheriae]|uniref:hypothetical protein n=1 Tax=Corynebacterium diphtheriae TaxID=1717 RepID=UPI001D1468CB|nr:hypothetical protein [Corynebacterium diphtheriae]UEB76742.1 hypothetical protein LK463_05090 [Corynebacterium diphtheriae]